MPNANHQNAQRHRGFGHRGFGHRASGVRPRRGVRAWSLGLILTCLAVAPAAFAPAAFAPAWADDAADARELVDKAKRTIEDFKADPDMGWFRDNLPDAQAVMVVPVLIKAGFIFGGSGGHGVVLWRDAASGRWSYPSFTFMGSITFGLQIGGEAAEVVLMIRSDKGRRALLSREFKLGGDVSVAAGPTGAGAQVATADVLAFSRTKGLFGGLTVEGAVIEPKEKWNKAYYGQAASPEDVLIAQRVSNPHADPLRQAIARARGDAAPATQAPAAQAPAAQAPAAQAPAAQAPAAPGFSVTIIQAALAAKGYDPGPIDGQMGAKTREAIRQYQGATGFEVTGNPSAALQRSLTGG
jgi:lipid-binding SYLF domain-containing protein